jgi:hypothetical protein
MHNPAIRGHRTSSPGTTSRMSIAEDYAAGWYDKVEAMQGANLGTYYAGESHVLRRHG